MSAVLKYPLEITGEQELWAASGMYPLSVQYQGDVLTLWAMVPDGDDQERRLVAIVGTGHPANRVLGWRHLGTVQDPKKPLVWHVFIEPWREGLPRRATP